VASSDPIVVTLKDPVAFGSELVIELRFRKPKAKDFRRLPMEPNIGDLIDLAGALCNQPKVVMDELSVDDFSRVMEIVGDFVPGGRGTGSTPSP
jgi:hypothetical protein